jgi:hypothetical protein
VKGTQALRLSNILAPPPLNNRTTSASPSGSAFGPGNEEDDEDDPVRDSPTPNVMGPKASKSKTNQQDTKGAKGKGKVGQLSKAEQTRRNAAAAGPMHKKRKMFGEDEDSVLARSLNVDLEDHNIVQDVALIWEICERCATHLEHSKLPLRMRCDRDTLLTRTYRPHLRWWLFDPSFPRRCTRCSDNNSACTIMASNTHSKLFPFVNAAIRAWLDW